MYYQGETITINVRGDEYINLSSNDFVVLVYPHYKLQSESNTPITLPKEMASLTSGVYTLQIPHEATKGMPVGDYDVEILIKQKNGNVRSIFKKTNAFYLDYSKSKTIS
jgi:hypothetical protein